MQLFAKPVLLGTLAYSVATFTLAVVWHVGLFKAQYQAFGYFDTQPNFILGLLSIIIQGYILSYLYSYVAVSGHGRMSPGRRSIAQYVLSLGVFYWSCHVLAFMAKQHVPSAGFFLALESFYLCLQFGLYGLALAYIYKTKRAA